MSESPLTEPATPILKPKSSIGRTLILWFLLLALLPMSLVAWISYQQATDSLTHAAEDKLEYAAASNIAFIQNWFDYRVTDLSSHAVSHANTSLMILLSEGLQQSGKTADEYVKSYDWAQRVDSHHHDLVTLARRYDYIYDLLLVDLKGNILFTVARESDLGSNLFSGPYANTRFAHSVVTTLKTGKIQFSDLERFAPSNNKLASFLSAPLLDEFGSKVGVLTIQINHERIINRIAAMNSADSSLAHYLVGEDGKLRSNLNNQQDDVLVRDIDTTLFKHWQHEHRRETPLANDEKTASEYIGADGRRVIGLAHTVHLPGDIKWVQISEIDRDEALASAQLLKIMTLVLVVLTSLITVGLAIFQARRITRPIIQLAEASKAFAEGEYSHKVQVFTNDEVGQLAECFNHMVESRRGYELALEHSNQEAQQALAALAEQKFALDEHAIVAITDIQGAITLVNDKFTEISGYTREELLGKNHRILNSGYHDKDFFREMYRTIGRGKTWHGEVCNRAKNGQLYWVDTTVVPFKNNQGKPQSYVAIRTDITQRKQAELAAKESEAQLQLVIESTEVGIWDWQVQSGQAVFNKRWAEIIGYTLDELAPISISTWVTHSHPDDLGKSGYLLEQHWRGETERYVIETRMRHKKGHWVWVLDTGKTVEWTHEGKPKRMIGTHLDITERKLAENELRQFKSTLDQTLDCVFMFNASDLTFYYASKGALQQVGYTLSELGRDRKSVV